MKPPPPSLVALHGFTGGGGDFAPLAEALPEWTWHTPDLPGHAPDLAAPGAPPDDCGLAAAIRYLGSCFGRKSIASKILLGYSLGGRLALRYALAQPNQLAALILIGASPGLADSAERARRRTEDEALAQKIVAGGVEAFLEDWQRRPLIATQARLPAAWRAAMRERRRHLRAAGLAASLRGFGQGALEPAWERLDELRMPVLLCAGAEDEKYVKLAAKMRERIARAELFIVPGAGHLAHLENRDVFAKGLREFLQKHATIRSAG